MTSTLVKSDTVGTLFTLSKKATVTYYPYPGTGKRFVIYCRISKDREGGRVKVEDQEKQCRALVDSLGGVVVAVYVDNDMSAYSGAPRRAYLRMLEDVKQGQGIEIQGITALHTDRLHRRDKELPGYIDAVEPLGVSTQTIRAGRLDLTTAEGRYIAKNAALIATREIELNMERTRDGKRRAREDGRPHGGTRPFGWLDENKTPHPHEGALIIHAVHTILAGGSLRSVAIEWNRRQVPTARTGRVGEWTGSRVKGSVLRAGQVHLVSDDRPSPPGWPRMTAQEWRDQWHACRTLLNTRTDEIRAQGYLSVYRVGSGVYRCGHGGHWENGRWVGFCGAVLRHGSNNSRTAYRCSLKAHLKIPSGETDRQVLAVVEGILDTHRGALIVAQGPGVDAEQLRATITTLEAKLTRLADMHGEGTISEDEWMVARARPAAELKTAMQDLAATVTGSALSGVADANNPVIAFRNVDVDRQRSIIREILTVVVMPHTMGVLETQRSSDAERVAPRLALDSPWRRDTEPIHTQAA